MRAADFDELRRVVEREAGIVLDRENEYAIESRVNALAQAEHRDVPGLLAALRHSNTGLLRRLCEAVTVNETRFFRDEHIFTALATSVIPALARDRGRLSIWCAASASGQEPYSVAMLLRELDCRGTIAATDLSSAMVERTRAGTYSEFEVQRGLSTARREQHMERVADGWQMRAELRAMVEPTQLNLCAAWPSRPRFDIVLMRNVLVYLNGDARRAILTRTRANLAPDGVLVLGAAESAPAAGFDRDQSGSAVFYRPHVRRAHHATR